MKFRLHDIWITRGKKRTCQSLETECEHGVHFPTNINHQMQISRVPTVECRDYRL